MCLTVRLTDQAEINSRP